MQTAALSTSGNDEVLLLFQLMAEKLYLVVTQMLICELIDMLLAVFEEINFTAFFFARKYGIRKLIKMT